MTEKEILKAAPRAAHDMALALAKYGEPEHVGDKDFFAISIAAISNMLMILERTTSYKYLDCVAEKLPELQAYAKKLDEELFPLFVRDLAGRGEAGMTEEEAEEWWNEQRAEQLSAA